jgi:acetamidase/formamidase
MRSPRILQSLSLIALLAFAHLASAADPIQDWVGKIAGRFDSPSTAQYDHVTLKANGSRLSGTWGIYALTGSIEDGHVEFTLTDPSGALFGQLRGKIGDDVFYGNGAVLPARRPGAPASAQTSNDVSWTLTRAAARPDKPQTWNYEPKSFYGWYSAAEPPVLHIFPGDTVNTRTMDSAGRDAATPHHGTADANVGPFYVEGALPGDTLAVHIVKLRTNKPTARQGSRFNQNAVTQAYSVAAKYDPNFNGEWTLDPDKGVATLHASDGLPHLTVPMKTMLGCISVAPAGELQYRGTDLGPYGGNLDYNDNVAGTTVYLPVFHPGALLGMGDVHAAMGDGEVVGTGLETSADVTFTVDVIRNDATPQPRAETADYLISFGVSGSVPESIQLATSQLAGWIKKKYKLSDSEVAILFAATLKYEITELVDSSFDVVAKVPKSILATMK